MTKTMKKQLSPRDSSRAPQRAPPPSRVWEGSKAPPAMRGCDKVLLSPPKAPSKQNCLTNMDGWIVGGCCEIRVFMRSPLTQSHTLLKLPPCACESWIFSPHTLSVCLIISPFANEPRCLNSTHQSLCCSSPRGQEPDSDSGG